MFQNEFDGNPLHQGFVVDRRGPVPFSVFGQVRAIIPFFADPNVTPDTIAASFLTGVLVMDVVQEEEMFGIADLKEIGFAHNGFGVRSHESDVRHGALPIDIVETIDETGGEVIDFSVMISSAIGWVEIPEIRAREFEFGVKQSMSTENRSIEKR